MALRSISGLLLGMAIMSLAVAAYGGSNEAVPTPDPRAQVEAALGAFAADLAAHPPTRAELPQRIRTYLEAHPGFFGSAVALIGADGVAYYSPYVYRTNGGLAEKDLGFPGYDIDHQSWLAEPRDRKQAVWTDPYFDAGGGEIWMVTRAVPLLRHGAVYAVVTTDLPVAPPAANRESKPQPTPPRHISTPPQAN